MKVEGVDDDSDGAQAKTAQTGRFEHKVGDDSGLKRRESKVNTPQKAESATKAPRRDQVLPMRDE